MTDVCVKRNGTDTFTIEGAHELADHLNTVSANFGVHYKVKRCSMTTARVVKVKDDGGVISKKARKVFKKKRSGGC